MQRRFFTLILLGLAACGGGSPAAEPRVPARTLPAEHDKPAPTTLERADVVAVVKAGLGRFLQKVDVEPSFEAGKFRGFRLLALQPKSFWRGVELKPGDVILSVNGLPIERETQAYDAFQSLLTAKELRVDYLREGQPRSLVYPITDAPK